jgi:hypothetical protein
LTQSSATQTAELASPSVMAGGRRLSSRLSPFGRREPAYDWK